MAIAKAVVALISLSLLLIVSPLIICTAESDNILYSGESLHRGESLTWEAYQFTMQEDCNLVLYGNGNPVWASNTMSDYPRDCYATLQSDGNFVVYSDGNEALWASNTNVGKAGQYVLILQEDRNVVIYGRVIWATNTHDDDSASSTAGIVINSKASTMEGFLPANATTTHIGSNAARDGMVVNNLTSEN